MSTVFDVVAYIFTWCRDTIFTSFTLGGQTFNFSILNILLLPVYASLTIFVIKHILDLIYE